MISTHFFPRALRNLVLSPALESALGPRLLEAVASAREEVGTLRSDLNRIGTASQQEAAALRSRAEAAEVRSQDAETEVAALRSRAEAAEVRSQEAETELAATHDRAARLESTLQVR